jgi:hypothetical protein
MAEGLKSETLTSTQTPMTLSITFQGPFLFDFKDSPDDDQTVDVYAPYCPYHEAGIFFGDNSCSETDIWTRANGSSGPPTLNGPKRKYIIEGSGIGAFTGVPSQIYPVRPPPREVPKPNDPILKPNDDEDAQVVQDKILFQITVPRPWIVYPMYCDVVDVVRKFTDKPSQIPQIYGTGLRFLYPWDTSSSIFLCSPGNCSSEMTPPSDGGCSSLPKHGEIEVRYQGIGLQDRNDAHSDARACFASLATLAGMNEWWLNYEDGMATPTNPSHPFAPYRKLLAHTGGDCGASVIALGLPNVSESEEVIED